MSEVIIAALNSIEMVTVPWWFLEISGAKDNRLGDWMGNRLGQLDKVLSEREWLATDRFTAADLLMAPRADQLAHFAAADESRARAASGAPRAGD